MKYKIEDSTKDFVLKKIRCMDDIQISLSIKIEALVERRNDCCSEYDDGITMGGTFITLGGENVTLGEDE